MEGLPNDIILNISKKLNVHDRARLDISLCRKGKGRDRRLGILFTALKRKVVPCLSKDIIQFLKDVPVDNQQTIREIADAYPEALPLVKNEDNSLINNEGTTSIVDSLMRRASDNIENLKLDDLVAIIKVATIEQFMKIQGHSWFRYEGGGFIMYMCLYYNTTLFEALANANLVDFVSFRKKFLSMSLNNPKIIETAMKYVVFSVEDLTQMYVYSINKVDFETAYFIFQSLGPDESGGLFFNQSR
jgi:hypothetical protein